MNLELDKQLCAKYPKIFANRNGDKQETCMCWGFECGDGWYDLLDVLCESLTYSFTTGVMIEEKYISLPAPQVVADQVKEKFGSLRFYYHLEFDEKTNLLMSNYPENKELQDWASRYQDYFNGCIHYAETLSARTAAYKQ